ncbi:Hypothetical protein FKW44_015932 [Caligus rogercresseyi]|uniref:Uncharacterized protein n=1 Tax=Caligus rogercresseyi TaxID=217165 RepID=A0A7T8H1B6_CALRO|nr:Hypothetical protein FKW44_015932 [Caligus rogercresseyi]
MLPPAYKADEEWPKWVESALRYQAKAAAAANRASTGASPVPTNPNIGTLYKRESLKLFALWLEEGKPGSSTEPAILSASTSVPPKFPPDPVFSKTTLSVGLC